MAHHTPAQKNSTQQTEAANANKAESANQATFQFADTRSGAVLQRQQQALIQRQLEGESPNRTGLPNQLKAGIEQLSGIAMDDVRVHYNSAKPAQFQAHAYAQGTDIHLAAGQEKHLAHEAFATEPYLSMLVADRKLFIGEAQSCFVEEQTVVQPPDGR